MKNNKGLVIWFTGLPGSGKTTYSEKVCDILIKKGLETELIDSHKLRKFTNDLGFGYEDRVKNVRRVSLIACFLQKHGIYTVVANIAPFYSVRDFIRKITPNYVQIYLRSTPEVLKKRREIYRKAEKGEIKNVVGVDLPYEEPRNPDMVIDTSGGGDIDADVGKIIALLEKRTLI